MTNTPLYLISVFAINSIGAAFVPIDDNTPEERLDFIFKDSSSKKILTTEESFKNINKARFKEEAKFISFETINKYLPQIENKFKKVFKNKSEINDLKEYKKRMLRIIEKEESKASLDLLSYIIYTSGSTGNPKGVAINNRNLANYMLFCKSVYSDNKTNVAFYSSISFDLTITSTFMPLLTGNTVYVFNGKNPQLVLKEIISNKDIDLIKLTPAHLVLLNNLDCSKSNVNKLIVGGDILSNDICLKTKEAFKNEIKIFNEYGPTEATVGCMLHEFSKKDLKYSSVPVGIASFNNSIYILNDKLQIIPNEYPGEMYISGKSVGEGYLNLDKMTDELFIDSPFSNEKMYKTGDTAIIYNENIMEYIGRKDSQVNINGYRVDLGDIYTKVQSIKEVKDSALIIKENKNKIKNIVLFYCLEEGLSLSSKDIEKLLKKSLPAYMIPSIIKEIDEIPLTKNGKVDKKELEKINLKNEVKYLEAENEIEEILLAEVLKLVKSTRISTLDNFFDLGLDSLSIIQIDSNLALKGYDLGSQIFYDYPSIKELSNYILNEKSLLKEKSISEEKLKNISLQIPELKKEKLEEFSYKNKGKTYLLIGVTGFVGAHLINELLKNKDTKIICITRRKNKFNAVERVESIINYYFGEEKSREILKRVKVYEGDLIKDKFGLEDIKYNKILNEVDDVILSAAIVKHYGESDLFYNVNVLGTLKCIDFCLEGDIPLHFVSTVTINGNGLVKSVNKIFDEDSLYIGQDYMANPYVKTKFEAEYYILKNVYQNKLKASIYRLGNITNRYSDGVFQKNLDENAFMDRIFGILELGFYPEELENVSIEFSPIDYISKFMVSYIEDKKKLLEIYHICNPNNITYAEMADNFTKLNYPVKKTNLEDFKKRCISSKRKYFGIINYMNDSYHDERYLSKLMINKSVKSLKNKSFLWPDITKDYLEKIIKEKQTKKENQ